MERYIQEDEVYLLNNDYEKEIYFHVVNYKKELLNNHVIYSSVFKHYDNKQLLTSSPSEQMLLRSVILPVVPPIEKMP